MNESQLFIVRQALRHLGDFRRTFNGALTKARAAQFRRLEATIQHLELVDLPLPSDLPQIKETFDKLEGGAS